MSEGMASRLGAVIDRYPGLTIALSGGVDSMTLAAFAHRQLADGVRMVHAVSPAVPPEATARVEAMAAERGWRLDLVDAGEFQDPAYLANPVDRCFFCKTNLYASLHRIAPPPVASGTNLDDLGDYRPGLKAAAAAGVVHPFVEAGIDKQGVRALARSLGLGAIAELPAAPCLSSRLETGVAVTAERLAVVHGVERRLQELFGPGDHRCRIRATQIEVQLDGATHAGLDMAGRDAIDGMVGELAARHGIVLPVAIGAYRRGSAFLRDQSM